MNIAQLQDAMARGFRPLPDGLPGVSASGNTTVGAGVLENSRAGVINLVVTQAATQEERTLPDPPAGSGVGFLLTLVLYSTAGAQVQITANTAFNASGNTHAVMTAVRKSVTFMAVPDASNTNLRRWSLVVNDGASLS